MKSEPTVYGISDLARDRTTIWDGVRNYQARNLLREMESGDLAFFYHSNTKPPGIAGMMKVVRPRIDDPSQFDEASPYYDPKSSPESPRWQTVEVEFVQQFPTFLPLDLLRSNFTEEDLLILRRGNRLSVTPVSDAVAEKIQAIAA